MTNDTARQDTPVLLMLFNRPEVTRQLFDKLRQVRPARLFIAANGPRPGVASDIDLCKGVRAVFDDIDWECEVHRNFPEVNVDMQIRWHASLDWFFESVDSGIILEDDCLPHPSFFSYSKELLERYKDDRTIMHINGSNFQFGNKRGDASYYFSKYPHVWGWATWKRAWQKYDNELASFPAFKEKKIIDTAVSTETEKKYWLRYFDSTYRKIHNSSDVKWLYSTWFNEGVSITPNVNMISNIGYGLAAGHTFLKDRIMGQEALDIGTMVHPAAGPITVDKAADYFTFRSYFHKNFFQKAFYKIVLALVAVFNRINKKS